MSCSLLTCVLHVLTVQGQQELLWRSDWRQVLLSHHPCHPCRLLRHVLAQYPFHLFWPGVVLFMGYHYCLSCAVVHFAAHSHSTGLIQREEIFFIIFNEYSPRFTHTNACLQAHTHACTAHKHCTTVGRFWLQVLDQVQVSCGSVQLTMTWRNTVLNTLRR